ncbi:MAG: ANTAR domain-containing protein [Lachnospiraceae bacterium]|nr:ANTAR domain-containing protein [Lachnospiraceae bacterium]
MVFNSRTYRVLIVSDSERFNEVLSGLLPEGHYFPVLFAATIREARKEIASENADIVLINAPLPDDYGTAFAIEISETTSSGVLFLVNREYYEETAERVSAYGVFTVAKPTTAARISEYMQMMCAMRERIRRMDEKRLKAEQDAKVLRLVNKAKWRLIETRSMTETEAQRFIEKRAMDERRSRESIAREILGGT